MAHEERKRTKNKETKQDTMGMATVKAKEKPTTDGTS